MIGALTGFLAPHEARQPDLDDEESQGELPAGRESPSEDAGNVDPEPKRTQQFPASMGLSVFLPPAESEVACGVRWKTKWPTA